MVEETTDLLIKPEAGVHEPITSYELFLDSIGGPPSLDPEKILHANEG